MLNISEYLANKVIASEIYEMAVERTKYIEKINSYFNVICPHILLILNARKQNKDLQIIPHWKREIKTYFANVIDLKLTVTDNKNKRLKYIKNELIKEKELDTNPDLAWNFYSKLKKEGYDLDNKKTEKQFCDVVADFQNNYFDKLIDAMASNKIAEVNDFINSL